MSTMTTSLSDFARAAIVRDDDDIIYTSRGNGCGSPWYLDAHDLLNDLSDSRNTDTPLVIVNEADDPEAWELATQALRDVTEDDSEVPYTVAVAPIDDNGNQMIYAF